MAGIDDDNEYCNVIIMFCFRKNSSKLIDNVVC